MSSLAIQPITVILSGPALDKTNLPTESLCRHHYVALCQKVCAFYSPPAPQAECRKYAMRRSEGGETSGTSSTGESSSQLHPLFCTVCACKCRTKGAKKAVTYLYMEILQTACLHNQCLHLCEGSTYLSVEEAVKDSDHKALNRKETNNSLCYCDFYS